MLDWIRSQKDVMLSRLVDWAEINSHSLNRGGLSVMCAALQRDFSVLSADVETIPLGSIEMLNSFGVPARHELGDMLIITKRAKAPIQILLGGHMDTVYPADSEFQNTEMKDTSTLRGPGVTDMKGGLAVMLTGLEALEKSPHAENVGYRILINPDEEIGSPGSTPFFEERAKGCRAALLFEPAFSDGKLASRRKGSINFTILVNGTSAHAGREFFKGKSAIAALSAILVKIHRLNDPEKETTLNLGYIYGGGPVNIVPDLAMCRLNIRAATKEDMIQTEKQLRALIHDISEKHEVRCQLIKEGERPPKIFDKESEKLYESLKACAQELKQDLHWRPTGGACDGNTLAAMGIPTVDSCGVMGGNIHTHEEFILVDSLVEKAAWIALYLTKLAEGKL